MQMLARLLINAAALWVAIQLVPGITFRGEWPFLLAVSLVFGALNVVVRPVLKFLTFPFFIVTLGLFTFVLNAIMLWLAGVVSNALDLGFRVEGFGAAFVGALLVTIVSFVLSLFLKSSENDKKS